MRSDMHCPFCQKSYRFTWMPIASKAYRCRSCKSPIRLNKLGKKSTVVFHYFAFYLSLIFGFYFWSILDGKQNQAQNPTEEILIAFMTIAALGCIVYFALTLLLPFFGAKIEMNDK